MKLKIIICIFSYSSLFINTSAFSLRDELSSYNGSSICENSPHPTCTTKSGPVPNAPCVFPFLVNNEKMWSCTTAGGFPDPWCATGVDSKDCSVLLGEWGVCDEETCDRAPTTETTENSGTSTTEHTETSTTVPPTPEDCWYDYLCDTNINIGVSEDMTNASTCQSACKALGNCNHFTWFNYHEQPHCWFLENCEKQEICSAPEFCKSGPADCKDVPKPCPHLDFQPGDHIIHWIALEDINPYMEPIPQGTTCITSIPCDTWKNATGPVPEVKATCQGGTNWTLFPPDVTYSDGSPFPKPSQGDPDC